MLVPYSRRAGSLFNPFHDLDALERAFFSDSSIGEFRTDIRDNGDEYVLEADLPGFSREDIHVDLNGESLTISAERHSDFEQKDRKGNYVRCERSYGSYARSFDTAGIDKAAIKAAYKDGVLRLQLPKLQQAAPEQRRLEIE